MSDAEVDPMIRDLVARRHGLGLSQREVARRAGLSNGGLSEAERGQHSPSLANLQAWARVLDYDVKLLRISPCVCGDCYHPVIGPDTDGNPCDYCRDCGCPGAWHTRMTYAATGGPA